ncbi:MAG: aminotransferase class V-fold PLP-dependent enzyme [Clostridiales Family XIII bacterium]|jgi:cysteine desulfurase family protein|nr:aminotransferase class V-fold PLP-dependent enzyme [Clostridiales Family XIII bacterium]
MIYLDNAATTWPKPAAVYDAATDAMKEKGGNPGRSGHELSLAAGGILEGARFSSAKLFGVKNPNRIVFTYNATDSLNLAINGSLTAGDHVITGSMEHNSVARPLEYLSQKGVEYTKVRMDPVLGVDPEDIKKAMRDNTKLVVVTHVSNVTGTINPIGAIGEICRNEGVVFLVDGSQSAGVIPIDADAMFIDLLAFPGHKGLLGPSGTGGLYIREGVSVAPTRYGGTGVHSELLLQPSETPYMYESGTPNVPGLAGLDAGIRFISEQSLSSVQKHEAKLTQLLLDGLKRIKGAEIHGPKDGEERAAVVSVTIEGADPAEAALILDGSFGVAVRAGLHCAPDAHRTLGTIAGGGTIRISPGFFNTEADIERCLEGIAAIAAEF